jgi:hypothetical protein
LVRLGEQLIVRAHEKSEVNPPTYAKYFRTKFYYDVTHWPSLEHFALEQVIGRMGNFHGHAETVILVLLGDAHARGAAVAPQATYVFQALDCTLFRVFNKPEQSNYPFSHVSHVIKFVLRLLHLA